MSMGKETRLTEADCDHQDGAVSLTRDGGLRCMCKSLLARYVRGGLELKCRRCKRTLVVPVQLAAPGDGEA